VVRLDRVMWARKAAARADTEQEKRATQKRTSAAVKCSEFACGWDSHSRVSGGWLFQAHGEHAGRVSPATYPATKAKRRGETPAAPPRC